jgi:CheY-like chemotaxis protein
MIMFRIGIVDDSEERIEEIQNGFEIAFPKGPPDSSDPDIVEGEIWELLPSKPLGEPENYLNWILENDIRVLIIDVNLREGSPGNIYDGPEIIDLLAKKIPKFPIVVVTNYPNDANLRKKFSVVTDIIDRAEWGREGANLAQRIVNFGKLFNDVFEEKIELIDDLAEKVANETASEEEINKLKSLQHQLEIMSIDEKSKIEKWMSDMEDTVENLSFLEKKAQEILENLEK